MNYYRILYKLREVEAMTEFHGDFTEKHPVIVIYILGSLLRPVLQQESVSSVSSGFPSLFRLTDFLPTAVLPTDLSISAPTRLEVIATAVSLLLTLYKYYITDFQKSQNFLFPLYQIEVAESFANQKSCN